MKTFLQKIIIWLPLAFLLLAQANMFFIQKYLYMNGLISTRYSVLQTSAFAGLALSLLVAVILGSKSKELKQSPWLIYKWYIGTPIIIIMVFLTLASMNR